MVELILIATGTALATGLGAIPVWLLGEHAERLRPALLGLAAGVMAVAALAGLLAPAFDEGSPAEVGAGVLTGIVFLLATRRLLQVDRPHEITGAQRTSLLVFAVLFVHSLPEGLAIGTAYASTTEGLTLFIVVAIAVQNIPEGTSVAIPMQAAGYGRGQQFWAAVATSLPQPIAAPLAYLLVEEVTGLLPFSFSFAAGAMLSLVVVEVLPSGLSGGPRRALAGLAVGGVAMLALSLALGV